MNIESTLKPSATGWQQVTDQRGSYPQVRSAKDLPDELWDHCLSFLDEEEKTPVHLVALQAVSSRLARVSSQDRYWRLFSPAAICPPEKTLKEAFFSRIQDRCVEGNRLLARSYLDPSAVNDIIKKQGRDKRGLGGPGSKDPDMLAAVAHQRGILSFAGSEICGDYHIVSRAMQIDHFRDARYVALQVWDEALVQRAIYESHCELDRIPSHLIKKQANLSLLSRRSDGWNYIDLQWVDSAATLLSLFERAMSCRFYYLRGNYTPVVRVIRELISRDPKFDIFKEVAALKILGQAANSTTIGDFMPLLDSDKIAALCAITPRVAHYFPRAETLQPVDSLETLLFRGPRLQDKVMYQTFYNVWLLNERDKERRRRP